MKKLIITVTIISFLNLVGCYYQEQMNPTEYKYDEKEDLSLTTKDTTYNLGGKDYQYANDTLIVTLSKKLNRETTLKTNVNIPIENIESVEVERTNVVATIGLTIAIIVAIPITAFALSGGKLQ